MDMRLFLIEGVPGSGKTTMARTICRLLRSQGIRADWYLEEAADHPVHPRSLTRQCHAGDFAESCLRSWRSFANRALQSRVVHIMEGSAFQSTVRFMMEVNIGGIEEYFSSFVDVVGLLSPAMLYLRPFDVVEHSRFISRSRGQEWTDKITRFEMNTPFAVQSKLSGPEGMHNFWNEYAKLCDSLLPIWTFPRYTIAFNPGNWKNHGPDARSYVESLVAFPPARKHEA